MRQLTAENFNTPATQEEKDEALATMKRQQHVNQYVLRTWDAQNPYTLTLGKLYGLTSATLGWGTEQYAKQHGVEIQHPKRADQ